MRTNIVIDDDLLKEAFSFSRARTKKRSYSRSAERTYPVEKTEGLDRTGWFH